MTAVRCRVDPTDSTPILPRTGFGRQPLGHPCYNSKFLIQCPDESASLSTAPYFNPGLSVVPPQPGAGPVLGRNSSSLAARWQTGQEGPSRSRRVPGAGCLLPETRPRRVLVRSPHLPIGRHRPRRWRAARPGLTEPLPASVRSSGQPDGYAPYPQEIAWSGDRPLHLRDSRPKEVVSRRPGGARMESLPSTPLYAKSAETGDRDSRPFHRPAVGCVRSATTGCSEQPARFWRAAELASQSRPRAGSVDSGGGPTVEVASRIR